MSPRLVSDLAWLGRWCRRHRRWCALWLVLTSLVALADDASAPVTLLGLGLFPGVACAVWHAVHPVSYERLCAGPARRVGWWWHCAAAGSSSRSPAG